MAEMNEEKD